LLHLHNILNGTLIFICVSYHSDAATFYRCWNTRI